jgi:nicotinamide mononucleotide adenylyltransferase
MIKQTYDLAITFGRFNLLHNGHIDLFERMATFANICKIGLSSASKNLPLSDRIRVIDKALHPNASKYQMLAGSNVFDYFGRIAELHSSEDIILILGEDQEVLAKAAERVFGWEYHLVRRLGSSTEVRGVIDNEQWDRLDRIVPRAIIPDVCRLRGMEISK